MGERIDWDAAGWERLAPGVGRIRLPGLDCTVGLVAGPAATGGLGTATGLTAASPSGTASASGTVLLVDAGGTLSEGARLRADAVRLLGAGTPVTHVALTHAHFDHVLGAAAFTGAEVYGAAGVGALIAADRAALRADAVRYGVDERDAAEAVDALVAPRHEIDAERTLDLGGGVRAVLVNAGPGHTAHDLAVLVTGAPGDPGGKAGPKVVFCGDLVEESGEPQAGPDAVPARWPDALDRLLALGGEDALYVPGHGAAVDAAFVRRQRDELAARFGVG